MKSLGPDFDLFTERAPRFVDVATVLASNAELSDLLAVLKRERDQLDLLLDLTNAVVSQLDTRELFRAVAPAIRRCVNADIAALSVYDEDARVLRHHVCDAPEDFGNGPGPPPPSESALDDSATGKVFKSGQAEIFAARQLAAYPGSAFILARGIQSVCIVPLATAHGSLGTLNLGAFSTDAFSSRHFPLLTRVAGQIAIALRNAFSYQRIDALNAQLAREKLYLEDEIRGEFQFGEILGRSPALARVFREIQTVAPTDSTVLITGETGSGKELVARAIHDRSERKAQAFVKMNCAAIPTGLLESELFGHEKGAFTGAIASRIGRFELASRGTVFLDEVGEIPLELQPKLLRVLQEREFERLGSSRTLRSNARLIAATNRDLESLAAEHTFRQDLFYRLNVFPIAVPALRERREDIPMLVRHFAQTFARRMNKPIDTIPTETMEGLTRYDWPGNVRELQNLIERAVILSAGRTLAVPLEGLAARATSTAPEPLDTLQEAERRHIVAALERSGWVLAGPNGAAARLGMKRSTLQFRMSKLGITKPQPHSPRR